jgi:ligand-binding sensor domain-containing protein
MQRWVLILMTLMLIVAGAGCDPRSREFPVSKSISGRVYVNTRDGLTVHKTPNGEVVDRLKHKTGVSLTGASQSVAGRTWVELDEGGWVDQAYLKYGSADEETLGQ